MALVLIVDDERDLASLIDFNPQQAGLKTQVAPTGDATVASVAVGAGSTET